MPNPMSQFLSALRGLEEVETPLSVETQPSTTAMTERQVDPKKMTPHELAESRNGGPISEE
jgi:hypothetical protein